MEAYMQKHPNLYCELPSLHTICFTVDLLEVYRITLIFQSKKSPVETQECANWWCLLRAR